MAMSVTHPFLPQYHHLIRLFLLLYYFMILNQFPSSFEYVPDNPLLSQDNCLHISFVKVKTLWPHQRKKNHHRQHKMYIEVCFSIEWKNMVTAAAFSVSPDDSIPMIYCTFFLMFSIPVLISLWSFFPITSCFTFKVNFWFDNKIENLSSFHWY